MVPRPNIRRLKVKRNYVPWNRDGVVLKRHLPVLAKPVLVTVVITAAWRLILQPAGAHLAGESQEPFILAVMTLLGLVYVLFATVAVSAVFSRYMRISTAVVRKDLDEFLLYRDEQLPILMHMLVGVPSILFTILVMMLDYHGNATTGLVAVSVTVFTFALVWTIAVELDDFNKSIWFQEKVPPHWYEVDIDDHFQERAPDETPL